MRSYHVFDKTCGKFCARKISSAGDKLKKGGIVGHESEPCPRCAFSSRAYAIGAARQYGLSFEKGEFAVLMEQD